MASAEAPRPIPLSDYINRLITHETISYEVSSGLDHGYRGSNTLVLAQCFMQWGKEYIDALGIEFRTANNLPNLFPGTDTKGAGKAYTDLDPTLQSNVRLAYAAILYGLALTILDSAMNGANPSLFPIRTLIARHNDLLAGTGFTDLEERDFHRQENYLQYSHDDRTLWDESSPKVSRERQKIYKEDGLLALFSNKNWDKLPLSIQTLLGDIKLATEIGHMQGTMEKLNSILEGRREQRGALWNLLHRGNPQTQADSSVTEASNTQKGKASQSNGSAPSVPDVFQKAFDLGDLDL